MQPKVIVIDGKTYHAVNEMPPDIRHKYEQAMRALGDANNNQIPDAFETMNILRDSDKTGMPDVLENIVAGQAAVNSMKIVIDGKAFEGIENLPPEVRARYEEAIRHLDANRNGVPDFVEGIMHTGGQTTSVSAGLPVEAQPRVTGPDRAHRQVASASPTITPDTSSGRTLMLAGLCIVLLCAAVLGAGWYFFFR